MKRSTLFNQEYTVDDAERKKIQESIQKKKDEVLAFETPRMNTEKKGATKLNNQMLSLIKKKLTTQQKAKLDEKKEHLHLGGVKLKVAEIEKEMAVDREKEREIAILEEPPNNIEETYREKDLEIRQKRLYTDQ